MATTNKTQANIHAQPLTKRILQGALLAPVLLILFLLIAPLFGDGDWHYGLWIISPLVVMMFGGACGGVVYFIMDVLRSHGGWKKTLANILTVLVYIVGMYMSLVLGLAFVGLWN
jgi:hypothetical protein